MGKCACVTRVARRAWPENDVSEPETLIGAAEREAPFEFVADDAIEHE